MHVSFIYHHYLFVKHFESQFEKRLIFINYEIIWKLLKVNVLRKFHVKQNKVISID